MQADFWTLRTATTIFTFVLATGALLFYVVVLWKIVNDKIDIGTIVVEKDRWKDKRTSGASSSWCSPYAIARPTCSAIEAGARCGDAAAVHWHWRQLPGLEGNRDAPKSQGWGRWRW